MNMQDVLEVTQESGQRTMKYIADFELQFKEIRDYLGVHRRLDEQQRGFKLTKTLPEEKEIE